jgi:NADH-quinone oxidoreductase subunit L
MFMTFHGTTRADHHTYDHAHESPNTMLIPLAVLSLGAVLAGVVFASYFIGHEESAFWGAAIRKGEHNHILHAMHDIPSWVGFAPFLAMLSGFALAYLYYIAVPSLPAATAKAFRPVYLFLLNKWYFDELYNLIFVKPAFALGRLFWKGGDGAIIDGAIDGTAASVGRVTSRIVKLQTGYVYHYAFAMLIGLALLLSYFTYVNGGFVR